MGYIILSLLSLLNPSVPQVSKFEFSPAITTTAINPYFPYDRFPPPGVEPAIGATVDALYLPPGAKQWREAPCFWFQPAVEFQGTLLPQGKAGWRCRFLPDQPGTWAYKVRVEDSAGVRETAVSYFSADLGAEWIQVSQEDPRFFEFSSSHEPFLAPLVNAETGNPFNGLEVARKSLASAGAMRFLRWFPNGEGANLAVISYGDDMRSSWGFGDASVVPEGNGFVFRPYYYTSQALSLPPGDYTLALRARGSPFLVEVEPGLGTLTVGGQQWTDYRLAFHNPVGQEVRIWIHGDGTSTFLAWASLSSDGGPNLLSRSDPNTHLYVDARGAALLDEILNESERLSIYHRLTLFHKNDQILCRLRPDGTIGAWEQGNLYISPASRWYQDGYTRYFLARWGYSPAIHSLEYANENYLTQESYAAAWDFTDYVHQHAPRPMVVSNSFWGYWVRDYFVEQRVDHGDQHLYAREGSTLPEVSSTIWDDSAAYARECQQRFASYSHDRPLLRGEGGVWGPSGFDQHQGINATYYHKLIWAQIGGPWCLGEWWPDWDQVPAELARLEAFFAGFRPYGYKDFETSNGNLRAWGMVTSDQVLLWVDNRLDTWTRVADGQSIVPASGTIRVPGVEGDWQIQWWDTATGTITNKSVHTGGELVLDIDSLAGDVAIKAVKAAKPFGPPAYLPLVRKGPSLRERQRGGEQ
jgi:hypothetical protein